MAERRCWHTLPDGTGLELLHMPTNSALSQEAADGGGAASAATAPPAAARPAPLLFVHGAFHGAWCWLERWLPFFAASGHDCYAVSLRGHGASELGTSAPSATSATAAGTAQSHADDLGSLIAALQLPAPPVLVFHSASSAIAAQYVSQPGPARPLLAGLVLLGPSPPSGNSGTVKRTFRRSPLLVLRIAWCFIRQTFRTSPAACRLLFFSPELPAAELERYRAKLAAAPKLALVSQDSVGGLPASPPTPAGWPGLPPAHVFVGRGALDVLVDGPAAEETAAFYGLSPRSYHTWEGLGHDCMLDARWAEAAQALLAWLRTLAAAAAPGDASAATE